MGFRSARVVFVITFVVALLACCADSEAAEYTGWTAGDAKGGYGTILRSTNSGDTWTRQGSGQIADADMAGVIAVDINTAWVVGNADAEGYATIYHTTDGGSTWDRKGSTTDVPDVNLTKVTAHGDSKVWAVGSKFATGTSAIMHTSDGGATWTNQLPAEYNGVGLQGVYTPDGTTVWVGGDSTPDGNGDSYALLLKSTDGGLSWTRQSGGDPSDLPDHILGISAVDANTAWAVGGTAQEDHLVLHTTNGGDTWTPQSIPLGRGDINEVDAVDTSTVWVAYDATVLWSADGGGTWSSYSTVDHTMGICAMPPHTWAVTYTWGGPNNPDATTGIIYHTDDNGKTWVAQSTLDGEDLPGLWTVSFVPEPATLMLFALGGLAVLRRRR